VHLCAVCCVPGSMQHTTCLPSNFPVRLSVPFFSTSHRAYHRSTFTTGHILVAGWTLTTILDSCAAYFWQLLNHVSNERFLNSAPAAQKMLTRRTNLKYTSRAGRDKAHVDRTVEARVTRTRERVHAPRRLPRPTSDRAKWNLACKR